MWFALDAETALRESIVFQEFFGCELGETTTVIKLEVHCHQTTVCPTRGLFADVFLHTIQRATTKGCCNRLRGALL